MNGKGRGNAGNRKRTTITTTTMWRSCLSPLLLFSQADNANSDENGNLPSDDDDNDDDDDDDDDGDDDDDDDANSNLPASERVTGRFEFSSFFLHNR